MTALTGEIVGVSLTGALGDFTAYEEVAAAIEVADLIGYWRLSETSGATADNYEGIAARDGTYTDVTLANVAGNIRATATFDGTTSYVDIYSASLAAAFDGAEGTMAIWVKVSGAGVWTDGVARVCMRIKADAGNAITIQRLAANNEFRYTYRSEIGDLAAITETGWFHTAVTWSASADEVKYYWDGAQVSTTDTGIGVWAGALSATEVVIGAKNSGAENPWSGYLAHAAIWTTPLTPAQILVLATA